MRDEIPPWAFAPVSQHPAPQPWTFLMIRSQEPLASLTPALTRVYQQLGITSDTVVWSLRRQVQDSLMRERLLSWLSGFFDVLAVLLSAVGLYGMIAYAVARRSNEIAIRIAIGATARDVLRMILGQASRILLIGVTIGAVASLGLGRLARGLLFGLEPNDASTLTAAVLILAIIGLTAAYLPAHAVLHAPRPWRDCARSERDEGRLRSP